MAMVSPGGILTDSVNHCAQRISVGRCDAGLSAAGADALIYLVHSRNHEAQQGAVKAGFL